MDIKSIIKEKKYNKLLIGKYDYLNKCNVKSGNILSIIPNDEAINREKKYFFVDVLDNNIKAIYGFVKIVDFFSIKDFLDKYNIPETTENIYCLHTLFEAVLHGKENDVYVVDFSQLEFGNNKLSLHIHKVILYLNK